MLHQDFNYIKHFDSLEIGLTGAKLEDVQFELLSALDRLRSMIKEPINLLRNGLTSGKHSSKLHIDGLAVDFYTDYDPVKLLLFAREVGFTDFGVYKNEKDAYSYHLGIGKHETLKTWYATKDDNGRWKYSGLRF